MQDPSGRGGFPRFGNECPWPSRRRSRAFPGLVPIQVTPIPGVAIPWEFRLAAFQGPPGCAIPAPSDRPIPGPRLPPHRRFRPCGQGPAGPIGTGTHASMPISWWFRLVQIFEVGAALKRPDGHQLSNHNSLLICHLRRPSGLQGTPTSPRNWLGRFGVPSCIETYVQTRMAAWSSRPAAIAHCGAAACQIAGPREKRR